MFEAAEKRAHKQRTNWILEKIIEQKRSFSLRISVETINALLVSCQHNAHELVGAVNRIVELIKDFKVLRLHNARHSREHLHQTTTR